MFGRTTKKQKLFRTALLQKEKPVLSRRSAQTERRSLHIGMTVLWILFFGTIIYSLFFSPWLVITEARILGESVVPRETLERLLEQKLSSNRLFLFPSRNLLTFPEGALQQSWLAEYPKFERVEVRRIFPHTLQIVVSEKPYIVRWCTGGPCFLSSSSEKKALSAEKSENPFYGPSILSIIDKSAIPITLGQELDIERYTETFVVLTQNLPKETGLFVEATGETPTRYAEELRLKTSEGWYLLVSTNRPVQGTLETLKRLLAEKVTPEKRKELLSLDLRTEGRIFLGFKTITEEVKTEASSEKQQEPKKEEKPKTKKRD